MSRHCYSRAICAVTGSFLVIVGWAIRVDAQQRTSDDRAATATATAFLAGRPVQVVLKNGTTISALLAGHTSNQIWLLFPDGHKESFDKAQIDLEASKGLPDFQRKHGDQSRPRTAKPNDLAAFAKSTKLKVPEDETQAKTIEAKAEGGTLSIGSISSSDGDASGKADGEGGRKTGLPVEVKNDIQALANGWSGFDRALAEVNRICTGYIQGRASCGGSAVVSKRNTAFCKGAIDRARTHLPGLETTHNRLWDRARRSGVSPGTMRTALRERGLLDFRNQLDRAKSTLVAWHGNLVD